MAQPKAILFDLDNTLADRPASITKFAKRFCEDFRAQLKHIDHDEITAIIRDADGGGYRPLAERWQMLQDRCPWHDAPSLDELRDYWYVRLGQCALGVEGLHTTLSALQQREIVLGIITNGPTGLQNLTVDTLHIRHLMACVIVSETVGIKKPESQIFQIALDEIDHMAQDVWFVGDNPATDILGAYQMGMTTVWVRGHHDWTDSSFQPDYTVDNISEMLSFF